nr:hypothetical protein CFP56_04289 [Quercus suber]
MYHRNLLISSRSHHWVARRRRPSRNGLEWRLQASPRRRGTFGHASTAQPGDLTASRSRQQMHVHGWPRQSTVRQSRDGVVVGSDLPLAEPGLHQILRTKGQARLNPCCGSHHHM